MKRIAYILAIICALGLTGCKLGQRYVRPDMDIPQGVTNIAFDSLAEMQWWQVYQDTILQQLIATAIENNKDLLTSEARVRELAARRRVSAANLLPEITGQVYAQKEGLNYGGDNYKSDPEEGLKASVSWELDIWGNLRWKRDQSIALLQEARENQHALLVSIVADVAIAYFELVALDNELEMVRNTLHARAEGVRLAKLRFEGGLTSETSYQQAQVEYARTATHVPVLEKNIEIKQNQLAFLIGSFPKHIDRAAKLAESPWTHDLREAIPSQLVARRPDIRAAEQKLIAANASVGIAYTNRLPRLALTATGGLESEEFSDLLKSPMHFLSAAVTGPIFDMGRRQGEYRAQQAVYEAQCYQYEKVVLAAFREVSDAITAYNKSKEIYQAMSLLRESASTTTSLAQLQYINGVISYLDLLDAQRSYFDAQVSVINAARDKRIALALLYKSLGGGF